MSDEPIKFIQFRAPIGASGGQAVGTILDYEVGDKRVAVEIGWMRRSEDQLKRVAKEYIDRERLHKPLEDGAYFRLSSKNVEALELFMKGDAGRA